jgi:hypothetical protein
MGWIGQEIIHLGGAVITRVNADVILPFHAGIAEGFIQELTH